MEVAGLVLGGIPLVIAALDNYQKCLGPAKKYWKYQSTLKLIRMNVFIQQEQLKVTLRSCIGLERPTHRDLQERLLQLYTDEDKCQQFINIISRMEKIVEGLMESLDIDAQGKPRWTKESPERAHWEWRRIRRSFGEKERQALFDELQRLNTGLMYIFEKAEVPSDDSDPMVQKLQARFSPSHCDAVRQNAQLLHEALSTAVHRCTFGEHQGVFRLDWNTETSREPGMFTLTLNPGRPDGWKTLCVKFPETDQGHVEVVPSLPACPFPPAKRPASRSPSPSRRSRWKSLFKPSPSPDRMVSVQLTGIRIGDNSTPLAQQQAQELQSLTLAVPAHLTCLCDFTRAAAHLPKGFLPHPRSAGKQLVLEAVNTPNAPRTIDCFHLSSVLEADMTVGGTAVLRHGDSPVMYTVSRLSRKQRFSIAAAACHGVLYLCGSPWLADDGLGKADVTLPLLELSGDSGYAGTQQKLADYPTLRYRFPHQGSDTTMGGTDESIRADEAYRFQSGQIRNKALFALDILLIELCFNRTFEQLRQGATGGSLAASLSGVCGFAAPTPSLPDDMEVANGLIDDVYLEAGYAYGCAVQRCLRCEFPGRDVTKSFDFKQFRRLFFNGVVAPVQAAYIHA